MSIKYPIELEIVIRLFCKQSLLLDVVVKGKRFGTKLPGFKLWPYHFLGKLLNLSEVQFPHL